MFQRYAASYTVVMDRSTSNRALGKLASLAPRTSDTPLYERLLLDFCRARGADTDAQAVVFNLYRAATEVIAAMEASALQPHGLSHAGFVLLMSLWITGPREIRELAAVQRVTRPAIVSAVGTLERGGLVQRVRCSSDRRLVRVELTAPGRALIKRVQAVQHRFEREVSRCLSRDEKRSLANLLRRITRVATSAENEPMDDAPTAPPS